MTIIGIITAIFTLLCLGGAFFPDAKDKRFKSGVRSNYEGKSKPTSFSSRIIFLVAALVFGIITYLINSSI